MRDKKILVLENEKGTIKEIRLREEAEKRGIRLDVLNCRSFYLSSNLDKISSILNDYSFFFSLSNQTYCNYITNFISLKGFKCWPDSSFLKFNDKFLQAQFLNSVNIKTPKTILLNSLERNKVEKLVEDCFDGFPCVIKKVTGTFGLNVAKANSFSDIEEFVKSKINYSRLTGKSTFLLQEFIEEACGEDYRVLVLNGKILGGMKRKSSNSSDFRANISLGGKSSSFDIPSEVRDICLKIQEETGGFYLGIDLIKKGQNWLIIEINFCPQFNGFEKETGVNVAGEIIDEINKIINTKID